MIDTGQMFIDGKINQEGLIKAKNVMPIPFWNVLDYGINKLIRSTNLPETRRDADYYSWVDRD